MWLQSSSKKAFESGQIRKTLVTGMKTTGANGKASPDKDTMKDQ
jgi:hypothetical protein